MKVEKRDLLEEHLAEAIAHPSHRYFFYVSLRETELIVPGTAHHNPEDEDGPIVNLQYYEVDGEAMLPVFSSVEKFHEAIGRYGIPYVALPGRMLLEAADDGFPWLLNPGFVPSKKIIPQELQTMKEGSLFFTYFDKLEEEQKKAYISERMTDLSSEMHEQLTSCLQGIPSIMEAYLVNVFNPAMDEQTVPLLIVKADSSGEEEAFVMAGQVREKVKQKVDNGSRIEVLPLDEKLPLVATIVPHAQPFYERGTSDDWTSLFR